MPVLILLLPTKAIDPNSLNSLLRISSFKIKSQISSNVKLVDPEELQTIVMVVFQLSGNVDNRIKARTLSSNLTQPNSID